MSVRDIGVAVAVKESELLGMTYEQRDQFGKETVAHLQGLLKEYVGHAAPVPGSEFRVGITKPMDDPLQGRIVTVNLQGQFRTEDLPTGCAAYLEYVVNEPGGS